MGEASTAWKFPGLLPLIDRGGLVRLAHEEEEEEEEEKKKEEEEEKKKKEKEEGGKMA